MSSASKDNYLSPYVKEIAYPKQVTQEGDVQRYGGMKMIRKDETIFVAYGKVEMRKKKDFDSRDLRLRAYLQVSVLA